MKEDDKNADERFKVMYKYKSVFPKISPGEFSKAGAMHIGGVILTTPPLYETAMGIYFLFSICILSCYFFV